MPVHVHMTCSYGVEERSCACYRLPMWWLKKECKDRRGGTGGTITLYTTTSRYLLLAHLLLVVVGEDF